MFQFKNVKKTETSSYEMDVKALITKFNKQTEILRNGINVTEYFFLNQISTKN